MRENKRGTVEPLNNVRHCKRLSASSNAEKHLIAPAFPYAAHKRVYSLGLASDGLY
jgi:hypothetical protein